MKASDQLSGASGPTINDEIRTLLEDRQFAADVLGEMTSFFSRLGARDAGNGETIDELLTIADVPAWELLQHELLQILEPVLYRTFLSKAAVQRRPEGPIVVTDENRDLIRAVRLFSPAGVRVRVAKSSCSDLRIGLENRPRYPPSASPTATRRRLDRLVDELAEYGRQAGPRKILISIEWIANVQILRPLLANLSRREGLSVHILRRSPRHDFAGISAEKVWPLREMLALGPEDSETVEREVERALQKLESWGGWQRLFRIGRMSIAPLVRRRLLAAMSKKRLTAAVCRATALRRFVDLLRPDLIVNADGVKLIPVALDWAAATRGIPHLKILHYDEQLFRMWSLLSTKRWDRAAVMGPGPRAALEALGVPPANIVHTGYPYFDQRLRGAPSVGAQTVGSPRVLFTAQGLPEESAVFGWLLDAFEKLPDYELVARPHPLQPASLDEIRERRPLPANVSISSAGDLHTEIRSCRLLVTISSITAIEAVMLGKPVLILEPRPGWPYFPSMLYQLRGVGRHLFDPKFLPEAIRDVCEDPELATKLAVARQRIEDDYFRFNQPPAELSATGRIERLIMDLLEASAQGQQQTHDAGIACKNAKRP